MQLVSKRHVRANVRGSLLSTSRASTYQTGGSGRRTPCKGRAPPPEARECVSDVNVRLGGHREGSGLRHRQGARYDTRTRADTDWRNPRNAAYMGPELFVGDQGFVKRLASRQVPRGAPVSRSFTDVPQFRPFGSLQLLGSRGRVILLARRESLLGPPMAPHSRRAE